VSGDDYGSAKARHSQSANLFKDLT